MFSCIDDVYLELCLCYDEAVGKQTNAIGEVLYAEHFFFCNTYELLNQDVQVIIAQYNFCKTFNCPPFPSLDVTPARIVEDFLRIDKELNLSKKKESNGN